jgi:signal transduction histidine kinase
MSTYPPFADFADPVMYLLQDPLPNTPESQELIGIRVTSSPVFRSAVASLTLPLPVNATTPVPFFNNRVAVTGLFTFAIGFDPGVIILTGVYDHDPMSQLVATVTLFSNFFDEMLALSPHAVLVITDQFGFKLNNSACALEEAEQVLSRSIPLTETVTWTVEIGQCVKYKDAFVTWRRNVMLAITISVTIMAEGVCLVIMLYQNKLIQQAVQRAREDEKAAAHQLIVGYICHELRNPLHIIKTSFGTLVGQIQRWRHPNKPAQSQHSVGDSGDQPFDFDLAFDDADAVTADELEAVIADAGSALAQMQATVNEVLDYRAMDGGLAALKLHLEFVRLGEVAMPVLMRCRAFLPNGVPLRVVLCDPEATICVDQTRLSQVITNGMRYGVLGA